MGRSAGVRGVLGAGVGLWGTHWVSAGVLAVRVHGGWKKGSGARAPGVHGGEARAHPLGWLVPYHQAPSPFQGPASIGPIFGVKMLSTAWILGASFGLYNEGGAPKPLAVPEIWHPCLEQHHTDLGIHLW